MDGLIKGSRSTGYHVFKVNGMELKDSISRLLVIVYSMPEDPRSVK